MLPALPSHHLQKINMLSSSLFFSSADAHLSGCIYRFIPPTLSLRLKLFHNLFILFVIHQVEPCEDAALNNVLLHT